MEQMKYNNTPKAVDNDPRTNIRKKVVALEKYNYNQKEFTSQDMVKKIKIIIEREVNTNDSK